MVFVMALSGCMVTKSAYVQKEEEANTLAKTVSDLDQRNKEITAQSEKLRAENTDLKKQLAAKDDLLQKKSEEIARQDAKQAAMVNEVERMKAQQARSGAADIKESPAAGKSAGLKSIRMKVLSGEGKIDSAKRMAKRLTAMGYKVESVAMAENADYPANTVYFTEKYKKEAKTLATRLGKNTIVKPLTWKSVFSIIVVTGG
jgi:chromosome segregation ATPase